MSRLRRVDADQMVGESRFVVDAATLSGAASIVEDVRLRGETAIREHSERFGDLSADDPIVLDRRHLDTALTEVGPSIRGLLERVAGRIEIF